MPKVSTFTPALLAALLFAAFSWVVKAENTNFTFTNHLARLKETIPAGFTVVVQPPFIVIGDESPDVVQNRASQTVKFTVDQLKQLYFKHDPSEIIDIWLFKD